MRQIFPLHPHIVSKIAAGEVIERPVYAVKELVENSLDAGADTITIHIEESGLKRITVIDNGEGMSKEDLQECFKAHTTSKLSQLDELSHITTLGFRGEALSSIAAISRLTIQSRSTHASIGTSIVISNGKIEKVVQVGMPAGTVVQVDHLFHSVPARKKFLKSARTEFRYIIDLLSNYALSYPHIHFLLTHNKKTILDLPKTTDSLYRIETLLGKDIFASLIPISYSDTHVSISGFLAKPPLTTRKPNKQFLFVNNRLITDKQLSLAVKAAYGSLIANTVYPICILSFSLPFEMVDVNVHPRKEQVHFVDTTLLIESTKSAVTKAFAQHDVTTQTNYWGAELFTGIGLQDAVGSTQSYAGRLLKEKQLPWELMQKVHPDTSQVLQLHNIYLLTPIAEGFLLIDQHAAHERILYEQLLDAFHKEKSKQKRLHLPNPVVITLNPSESELLKEQLHILENLGWEIEYFKGTTFLLRSIPSIFQDRDYKKLLREMLEGMIEEQLQSLDDVSKRMIAYLACRSAVKAGDRLTKKQAKELLEQLEKTNNNATCPHGRPTKVAVSLEKINKLFKR